MKSGATNILVNTQKKLLLLRNKIIELTHNKIQSPEQSIKLSNSLIELQTQIFQYALIVKKAIQLVKQDSQQAFFNKKGDCFQNLKVNILLWQILNFICINSSIFSNDLQPIISLLLEIDVDFQISQSVNSLKNAHIFIHNLACKIIKNGQYEQYKAYLLVWFSRLLVYHFERTKNKYIPLLIKFQCKKGQEIIVSEMEWLGYIFHQLFNVQNKCQGSIIQQIVASSVNTKIAYYVLHMIGNYFQEMVDKRVTTELVFGFECNLSQVKQMYQAKGLCLVQIKISRTDLSYICSMFKTQISSISFFIKQYISCCTKEKKETDLAVILQKWNKSIQIVMEICHIFNCVLFIGGYNNKLQNFVIQHLLEKDKVLLSLLEISYLLYRNIQSTKYQTKLALMIQIEKQAKIKLLKLFQVDIDFQTVDVKQLQLNRILTDGQLVSVLRLLANLVHINHRAQLPFQIHPQYLHMILSLTHDSVSQITMKEWAIMFIRNVCEWSEKLRNEIGKIKMEVKIGQEQNVT